MDRHAAHNRPMVLPKVLVVMGVSGSGKTTVGKLLAERLGWRYQEGDALHPLAAADRPTHRRLAQPR